MMIPKNMCECPIHHTFFDVANEPCWGCWADIAKMVEANRVTGDIWRGIVGAINGWVEQ